MKKLAWLLAVIMLLSCVSGAFAEGSEGVAAEGAAGATGATAEGAAGGTAGTPAALRIAVATPDGETNTFVVTTAP